MAAMCHPQHQHDELFVLDVVADAVVAGTNWPFAGAPDELGGSRRPGVAGQQF